MRIIKKELQISSAIAKIREMSYNKNNIFARICSKKHTGSFRFQRTLENAGGETKARNVKPVGFGLLKMLALRIQEAKEPNFTGSVSSELHKNLEKCKVLSRF